jgi:anti-sigma regulatory factor (Ser/Thr protein kinase)
VLTPETGELVYSSGGHPPPILVQADRATRLLDDARAMPLGLPFDRPRPEGRDLIPPRATLLLYTDGLVERRKESLDQGIARAAGVVEENRATALDDLADEIMSGLAPGGGYQDDVALLLYRQPSPLELEVSADANQLAFMRAALRRWLKSAGVGDEQTMNVLIAVGEALANAIEHGHRDRPEGAVSLRAVALADRLQLTVSDTGLWKPPDAIPDSSRGRGIALMRALMHEVTIQQRESGTTVHLHARIA